MSDNVIKLFPDLTRPESFDNDTRDQILTENRDEMLEMLDGIRGRVMAFDIRGIVLIGFAGSPDQDIVFQSNHTTVDPARTVGSLEFVKQSVVDMRLRQIEYEEE